MPNLRRGMMAAAGAGGLTTYSLFVWGNNETVGALGDGTKVNKCSPIQIGDAFFGELDVTDVFATQCRIGTCKQVSAAVKGDGTLWMWGYNADGGLGQGNTTSYSSPVQVGSLTDWRSVSPQVTTLGSTTATKTDGTLWGWGDAGAGHASSYSSPVQIGTDTDWSPYIGGGDNFSWALKTTGALHIWGSGNAYLTTGAAEGAQVTDKNFSVVGAGSPNAIMGVEKDTGKLWSWGTSSYGFLGHGNDTSYSSPVQVGALTDWTYCGGCVSPTFFYINNSGEMYGTGRNDNGNLGLGNTTSYSSPVQLPDKGFADLGSGSAYNIIHGITTAGALWYMGGSGSWTGTQGTGTSELSASSPVQVGTDTTWVTISSAGGGGRTESNAKLAIKESS